MLSFIGAVPLGRGCMRGWEHACLQRWQAVSAGDDVLCEVQDDWRGVGECGAVQIVLLECPVACSAWSTASRAPVCCCRSVDFRAARDFWFGRYLGLLGEFATAKQQQHPRPHLCETLKPVCCLMGGACGPCSFLLSG